MSFLKAVFSFFKSIKLAIVLILYLAITSALSTLVPQGENVLFYNQNYSHFIARLIVVFQFHRFFRSVLFLVPLGGFFINLATCTVDRLARRLRSRVKKRYGPDSIHIGILVLILGGMLGMFGRTTELYNLRVGESLQLPGGHQIFLKNFEFHKYEDGRPKDWLSEVEVIRDDEFLKNYTIEVNRPLKIGRMKVYQSTYSQNFEASVSAPDGVMYTVRPGDYYWTEDSIVVFRGIEIEPEVERELKDDPCVSSGHAVFQEMTSGGEETGHTVRAVYRVAISEMIDQFTIEKLCISYTTGLQVVKDISFIPVIIALIMIGGGMSLAFIQKIGDTNK